MAWHTLQEAQKLTGKSRSTLYRDMSKGLLSWAPEGDNARRLETSELIRVYGALLPMTQPETEKVTHAETPLGTHEITMILAELKSLREEVAELRNVMRLLEHKPAPLPTGTPVTPEAMPEPKQLPWWRRALNI